MNPDRQTLLWVEHLSVFYGAVRAVHDVSIEIARGEVVSLIGLNGAGKSTILRAISRIVDAGPLSVLEYDGTNLADLKPENVVRAGVAHAPEGRRVLSRLSVEDNLMLGAYVRRDAEITSDLQAQYQLFPRLRERRSQLAGTLSGGEQQMLAIARALMSRPKLLLLDEPSLGLAPLVVKEIFATIDELRRSGVTILLVEQNASLALHHSDRAYVIETGHITTRGPAAELLEDQRVRTAYLGH